MQCGKTFRRQLARHEIDQAHRNRHDQEVNQKMPKGKSRHRSRHALEPVGVGEEHDHHHQHHVRDAAAQRASGRVTLLVIDQVLQPIAFNAVNFFYVANVERPQQIDGRLGGNE